MESNGIERNRVKWNEIELNKINILFNILKMRRIKLMISDGIILNLFYLISFRYALFHYISSIQMER
jgi:hypothetical protein